MGIFSDLIGGFTGSSGAKAARGAADVQKWATGKAINETRRIEAGRKRRANAGIREVRKGTNAAIRTQEQYGDRALSGYTPAINEGFQATAGIGGLVADPNAQRDFIENNPFFDSLITGARNDLFANQAARGKVGSGETAAGLQDAYLRTGSDLLNQNINQRLAVGGQGLDASRARSTVLQNTGNNISNLFANRGTNIANLEGHKFQGDGSAPLLLQGGNATAAGIVGAANAKAQGAQNLVNTGLGIGQLFAGGGFALSDMRAKEGIRRLGATDKGIGIYAYRYRGSPKTEIGVMAQEVEGKVPGAVAEFGGLKHVDYEAVANAHQ